MTDLFTVGFPTAVTLQNLFYCFAGVFLGTFIGALPGIGALAAVSLLFPVTFYLDPTAGIVMLAGVYYGSEYGGSTASILLNLPGSPASAVTCLDGYPMTQQGRGGIALFVTTIASFVGGSIGILLLTFLAPAIIVVALSFQSADYFAAMLFALVAASSIGQGAPLKGIAMVVVGLLLGSIGIDVNSGHLRYVYSLELSEGLELVVLAMGLFGIAEVIASIAETGNVRRTEKVTLRSMIPSREDTRRSVFPTLRGTAIGSLFGSLPGTGPTIASFISYAVEKRVARNPEKFGKGAIEGVAAPEAANNAAAQTAFIPTLSLGIPGSATMAIILGAMMIQGITPGPQLMVEHPDLFWGVVASFWIGNVFLVILNIPLIGIWVRLLRLPYNILFPTIIVLVCVAIYSIETSVFDIWMLLAFGLLGYVFRLLEFPPAPLLIGFILGPMVEENFRRAMMISRGDFMVMLDRPIAASLLALTVALVIYVVWSAARARRSAVAAELVRPPLA